MSITCTLVTINGLKEKNYRKKAITGLIKETLKNMHEYFFHEDKTIVVFNDTTERQQVIQVVISLYIEKASKQKLNEIARAVQRVVREYCRKYIPDVEAIEVRTDTWNSEKEGWYRG